MKLMEGKLRCGVTLEELIGTRQKYGDHKVGAYPLTVAVLVKDAEQGDLLKIMTQKLVPASCGVNPSVSLRDSNKAR